VDACARRVGRYQVQNRLKIAKNSKKVSYKVRVCLISKVFFNVSSFKKITVRVFVLESRLRHLPLNFYAFENNQSPINSKLFGQSFQRLNHTKDRTFNVLAGHGIDV